jgi:N-acetylneuraminic acid mutarotase
MSIDKMSVDKMSVDKMSVPRLNVNTYISVGQGGTSFFGLFGQTSSNKCSRLAKVVGRWTNKALGKH